MVYAISKFNSEAYTVFVIAKEEIEARGNFNAVVNGVEYDPPKLKEELQSNLQLIHDYDCRRVDLSAFMLRQERKLLLAEIAEIDALIQIDMDYDVGGKYHHLVKPRK